MTITALPPAPSTNDPSTFDSKADALIAALPTFINEVNEVANGLNFPGLMANSTTSVLIGTGSKSFTIDTGKTFVAGQSIFVQYTTTPTNWMYGTVTSYNSGTGALVVNVTSVLGSGTYALWTVSLGEPLVSSRGFSMTGAINEALATVASATTPNIFGAAANVIDYTGSATCTGFAAASQAGARRTLVCAGAAVFTAGANMLIDGIASGQNFSAAAGDKVHVIAVTTTQFRLTPAKQDRTAVGSLLNEINYTAQTQALTSISNGTPAVFTCTSAAHLPETGSPIQLTTSGGLPTGLSLTVTYYVTNPSGSTYNVCLTYADALAGTNKVATSSAGSGTHTMNSIYVKNASATYIIAEGWGAGGGTGGCNATPTVGASPGGGAGAYFRRKILTSALAATETITIGAGGVAGTNSGGNGGTGGTTSFGAWASATGGLGSNGLTASSQLNPGANGGTATGGDLNLTGNGSYGVGAIAGASSAVAGLGAATILGGAKASPLPGTAATGVDAPNNSGAGATGCTAVSSAKAGGVGGSGRVLIKEYA